jgi:O-antigen/teichoic acid export membrane protein
VDAPPNNLPDPVVAEVAGGADFNAPAVTSPAPSSTRVYTRNVFITGVRLMVFAAIGVLLPSFLTHRLSISVYGAWILILQLSSYIGYLDLGAQTGIAKYIAEYTALKDDESCNRYASAGIAITMGGGLIGIFVSVALAWLVPVFFRGMPTPLLKDVSHGVLLVGISTAILLATSAIGGIFLGLQRYSVPVLLAVANKSLYACVLVLMVLQHRSLTVMGLSVAAANLVTAGAQVFAWHRLIPNIRLRPTFVVWPILKQMLLYCAVLGIWTSGMILISGLDTTIVGHYRFNETAFYGIAAIPVVFLNQLLLAALGPLMPATSALSVTRTPVHMGTVLERSTRYAMLIQLAASLPLMLFGYSLLSLWVGPEYARHSLVLMRILLLANVIRNTCLPFCSMVLATGMQRYATLSGICEAVSNLAFSMMLGRMFGAVGVAAGTLIGSVVGVLFHFLVSMKKTQATLAIPGKALLLKAVLRPSLGALPTMAFLPFLWTHPNIAFMLPLMAAWLLASAWILWGVGLNATEKAALIRIVRSKIGLPAYSLHQD